MFNPLRLITHSQQPGGNRTQWTVRYLNERQGRVKLVQKLFLESAPDLKFRNIMCVRTHHNLVKEEELFADKGILFEHQSEPRAGEFLI